ncbi:MAG: proline--tRNA ligase [Nitrospinaceae bacterium]|nr:proline--tRNA ligase [Nitrospina sp.]MBT5869313.1 proline--tRNA ligase [Nitrospinaceae bacterium]MBT6345645.1 proline--tRNA ligase [Nitrospina sp.]
MHFSKLFAPTLKESPADAEVISHKLMVRAGMIRQVASGIYSILPLGLRVLRKVEQIIREEINQVGGQEVFLPSIQPAELWIESKRWDFYGKELLRFKDRHNREFCYGPTHEEVITDVVRKEIRSYRQLPVVFYQIQTKFRDEVRPRFGIMRGREFMMKDAYSFHVDEEDTQRTYHKMAKAYSNIFNRCGLKFKQVQADSGTIGGSFSHEFAVLADSGEDNIGFCELCGYASNVELAKSKPSPASTPQTQQQDLKEVETPGKKTVEEVASFLNIPAQHIVKTILFENENGLVAGLVRGDHEINLIKMKNLIGCESLHPAEEDVIAKHPELHCGYLGPIGLKIPIYVDHEVSVLHDFVTGANKPSAHFTGVQVERDLKIEKTGDLRTVMTDDPCPNCETGKYQVTRGIEVGHIFILGTKYSSAMKAVYIDQQGKENPMVMGCYGIGVGRTAAAAIEQNHDERGIVWPRNLAPFQVVIIPVNYSNDELKVVSDAIYERLQEMGIETLLDDRSDRLGGKLKDADLIGVPLQIIIGPKNLAAGQVEIKIRKTNESNLHPYPQVVEDIPDILKSL